ncbi:MAG: DNA gyrase subunit A, partial [Alphaproteobacteria bacterium]
VVSALTVQQDEDIVLVSETGYGKRILYSIFKPHGRGTRGQICYKTSAKTGPLVKALSVAKKDDLICITAQGTAIKLKLKSVPILGKSAAGVRVVSVDNGDAVVGIAREEAETTLD